MRLGGCHKCGTTHIKLMQSRLTAITKIVLFFVNYVKFQMSAALLK